MQQVSAAWRTSPDKQRAAIDEDGGPGGTGPVLWAAGQLAGARQRTLPFSPDLPHQYAAVAVL